MAILTSQDPSRYLRDVRTVGEKLHAFFGNRAWLGVSSIVLGVAMMVAPLLLFPGFLFGVVVLLIFVPVSGRETLPLRMPKGAGGLDYNSPRPDGKGYDRPEGMIFLGNDWDGRELWLTGDDFRTHMALFGTTGSGKTEFLIGLAANSILAGAGCVFVDPKGSPKLVHQLYAIARLARREDDFLVVDFRNPRIKTRTDQRYTNTVQPLSNGSPDDLFQMISSLIPENKGENAIFSQRAVALLSAVIRPLVDLRDKNELLLSFETLRDHMSLDKLHELVKHPAVSEASRAGLMAYLESISGYRKGVDVANQPESVHTQHGYAVQYFTRAFSSLTEEYGHVYRTAVGEIDYTDVVLNRRILVVIMPSMAKSSQDISMLGKVILAGVRNAMAVGLGNRIEGTAEDAVYSLPGQSEIPTVIILDEYAYIAVDGFAVTAAQSRSMGFSCVFAGQDYAGWERNSPGEAEQILSNTNVKCVMRLEDPQKTLTLAKNIFGEAVVTEVSGYTMAPNYGGQQDVRMLSYVDNQSASVTRRSRVEMSDFKVLGPGQFFLAWRDRIIKGRAFYAAPNIDEGDFRINRLSIVRPPTPGEIALRYGNVRAMLEIMRRGFRGGQVNMPEPLPPLLAGVMGKVAFLLEQVGDRIGVVEAGVEAVSLFIDDMLRGGGDWEGTLRRDGSSGGGSTGRGRSGFPSRPEVADPFEDGGKSSEEGSVAGGDLASDLEPEPVSVPSGSAVGENSDADKLAGDEYLESEPERETCASVHRHVTECAGVPELAMEVGRMVSEARSSGVMSDEAVKAVTEALLGVTQGASFADIEAASRDLAGGDPRLDGQGQSGSDLPVVVPDYPPGGLKAHAERFRKQCGPMREQVVGRHIQSVVDDFLGR